MAGAYIEHHAGDDIVALYRRQIDTIVRFEGIPILFQTARLHGKPPARIAEAYRDICRDYPHVLAFELGPMFAANGEICDSETIRRLMDIPEIKGMKHSSLDRLLELERLALRDALPARLSHLHRERPGNQHDRIWIGLLAGTCRLCAREIRGARPALGDRGPCSTTRSPTLCSTWEMSLFAPPFPRTNIPPQCS